MKKTLALGLLIATFATAAEPKKKTDYSDWIDCVGRLKPASSSVGKVFKTEPRTIVLPGDGPVAGRGRVKGIFVGKGKQCLFYPDMSTKDDDLDLEKVKALKGGDFCDNEKFEIQLGAETFTRIRNMFESYNKAKALLSEKDKVDRYVLPLQACQSFVPEFLKQDVVDELAKFGVKPTVADDAIPLDAHPMRDPVTK